MICVRVRLGQLAAILDYPKLVKGGVYRTYRVAKQGRPVKTSDVWGVVITIPGRTSLGVMYLG